MPNTKISARTAAGALTGTELLPIVQGGNDRQTTIALINAAPKAATDAITANATGGQGPATVLSSVINRITTAANATAPFASVLLPASLAGSQVTIVNSTTNPIQVFGTGTDTINAVASGTGVTQMQNSAEIYTCAVAGLWQAEVGSGYSGNFMTEQAVDNVVASATGTQASGVLITGQTARIITAANAAAPFSSIKLPVSSPGLELLIINHGANPIGVFGSGTDTINDVATATGVVQMQQSLVIYTCTTAGAWYTEGLATGYTGTFQTASSQNAMTAHAGGGAGFAGSLLTNMITRVTTVATLGDSVTLPTSAVGLVLVVSNAGANPMDVFPASGDAINALAINTAVRVNTQTTMTFYCTVVGTWHSSALLPPPSKFVTINVTVGTLAIGNITGAANVALTSTNAAPGTQTTRTATQMFADAGNVQPGDSYVLRITNTGAGLFTLAAGAGVTLGTGTYTVPTNTYRDFTVTFTTATALTIQTTGVGTWS